MFALGDKNERWSSSDYKVVERCFKSLQETGCGGS